MEYPVQIKVKRRRCCRKTVMTLKTMDKRSRHNLVDFPKCYFLTEDTRLSNPASNLRGTGINRFNPLCLDPQKYFICYIKYNQLL